MESTVRDRGIAAASPLIYLALSLVLPWWSLVALVVAYIALCRTALILTRDVVLKMLDLLLSIVLISLGVGALVAGMQVVASDGAFGGSSN
ncbi:hypothetical protein ACYCAX_05545 [Pseudomonas sp. MT3]